MHEILRQDAADTLKLVRCDPLANKTVLIIGSNGLIGAHLALTLHLANETLGLGVNVIGISRHPPAPILKELAGTQRFRFYSQDLTKGFNLKEKADFVFHGATYGQPKKFLEDPLSTIKLNTQLTETLLEWCCANGARMLFASSAFVYGQPDSIHIPTPETYNGNLSPLDPRAPYGESKRLGETLCQVFRQLKQADVKIARISETYGPAIPSGDRRALGDFLRQALSGQTVELEDSGSQKRAWCYIADCGAMLLNILIHGKDFVYNVGSNHPVSIRELAELICELTGAKFNGPIPKKSPPLALGAQHVELDLAKVMTEFHIKKFISLKEGLSRIIKYQKTTNALTA